MAAVTRHGELTKELAETLRELGGVRKQLIAQQAAAWGRAYDLPVTERREHVRHITASFASSIADLEMECKALEAEIAHEGLVVAYGDVA